LNFGSSVFLHFVDLIGTAEKEEQEKGSVLRTGSERDSVGTSLSGNELVYAPGRPLCFREDDAKAAQQADIAITIKVQVTVNVGEAELFPL
jgi:hypothetical protein